MHATRDAERRLPGSVWGAAQGDGLPVGEVARELHERCARRVHDETRDAAGAGFDLERRRARRAAAARAPIYERCAWIACRQRSERRSADPERDAQIATRDASADRVRGVAPPGHDERRAFPECDGRVGLAVDSAAAPVAPHNRKSTRLNSSHLVISYAVFCLKKKNKAR